MGQISPPSQSVTTAVRRFTSSKPVKTISMCCCRWNKWIMPWMLHLHTPPRYCVGCSTLVGLLPHPHSHHSPAHYPYPSPFRQTHRPVLDQNRLQSLCWCLQMLTFVHIVAVVPAVAVFYCRPSFGFSGVVAASSRTVALQVHQLQWGRPLCMPSTATRQQQQNQGHHAGRQLG